MAYRMGVGLAMIRKPGKLPYQTHGVDYALEYGTDRVEMHVDAIKPGQRVLLIDDLLATGGTAGAAVQLLDQCGATLVGCGFVVELGFLNGAERLRPHFVDALLRY